MILRERIKVWLSPNKIHKLKLTNTFNELVVVCLRVLFGKLARAEKTRELEEAFRSRFDTKRAIVFPHARTALHFILRSMDLEEGSEVLMSPLTVADMVNSIHTLGLKPVFVDVEPDTFCIDPEAIKGAVTPRSKVILVTYVFGIVPNMAKIRRMAEKHGLTIIEDGSQCFGASYNGQNIGTFGEAAFFSLTNFKVCSSLFGGMVVTDNEEMAKRLEDLRESCLIPARSSMLLQLSLKNLIYSVLFSRWIFSYFTYFIVLILEKIDPKITYHLYSGNIKTLLGQYENRLQSEFPSYYLADYSDFQAEVGLGSFARTRDVTSARSRNGDMLRGLLQGTSGVKVPVKLDQAVNVYWRFPIVSSDAEGLKGFLLEHGVDSSPTYLTLCSKEPGFEPYHASMPNAERLKKDILLVEVNEELNEDAVRLTASLVRSYLERRREQAGFP